MATGYSLTLTASYGGGSITTLQSAVQACLDDIDVNVSVRIPASVSRAMQRYLYNVAGRLAAKHSKGWQPTPSSDGLYKRSGRGVQSIVDSVEVTSDTSGNVTGYIGGNSYMGVQEYGATIRARSAKYLTIPLPAALNAAGIPLRRSARQWSNTFVRKSKNGNLIIFQKTGKGLVPLYLLKKSVKIPKRLGMYDTLVGNLDTFEQYLTSEFQAEFSL